MTKDQIEKLLKTIIKTNETLAMVSGDIAMVNERAMNVLLAFNTVRPGEDENGGPTIQ